MVKIRSFPSIPGTPALRLALALALTMIFGFVELVDEVFEQEAEVEEIQVFDQRVMQLFSESRLPRLTQAMIDITALGSVSVILLITVYLLTFISLYKDWLAFFHLTISLIGAALIPQLLKAYYARTRPDLVDHLVNVSDLSFPSGHAFGSMVAYSTFAYFGARYLKPWRLKAVAYSMALFIVLLIGVSRVYLGVHYPSDVMAGYLAGGAWSCLVIAVFSLGYRKKKVEEPSEV